MQEAPAFCLHKMAVLSITLTLVGYRRFVVPRRPGIELHLRRFTHPNLIFTRESVRQSSIAEYPYRGSVFSDKVQATLIL
jgi:hypothetical protein